MPLTSLLKIRILFFPCAPAFSLFHYYFIPSTSFTTFFKLCQVRSMSLLKWWRLILLITSGWKIGMYLITVPKCYCIFSLFYLLKCCICFCCSLKAWDILPVDNYTARRYNYLPPCIWYYLLAFGCIILIGQPHYPFLERVNPSIMFTMPGWLFVHYSLCKYIIIWLVDCSLQFM